MIYSEADFVSRREGRIYQKLKKTAKHTLIFGVGGLINRAVAFLLLPLYLTYLRPGEYGALGLMMIVLSLVNVVLPLGIGNALMRSYFDFEERDRPRITTTALVFLSSLCVVVLVPLYLLSPFLAELVLRDGEGKYVPHFQLVFIIAFFQVMKVIPDAVLRVRTRSVEYTVLTLAAFFAQLVVIFYLVIGADAGIRGVLVGTLVGAVVETVGLFALIGRDLGWGFDRKELWRMLAFGSPLIFGRLSATCLQYVDRFFLQHYAVTPQEGKREVGFYTMANNVSTAVTFLVTIPFGAVWPAMQVSVMKDEDAREYYARILTYVLYVASFFALGAACVAGDVFRYFGKYTESAAVVPPLALAAVLDAASQVLSVGISLKRKTYVNPMLYATAALVNVGLNVLLVPRFGMHGAAWATVIGLLILCWLRLEVSQRLVHVPYEWTRLARLAVVGGGLYWLAMLISTGRTVVDFLLHAAVACAFPLCLALTGFHDARELKKLAEYRERVLRRMPLRAGS